MLRELAAQSGQRPPVEGPLEQRVRFVVLVIVILTVVLLLDPTIDGTRHARAGGECDWGEGRHRKGV